MATLPSSQTLSRAVDLALEYLGFGPGVPRVTQETVQAVKADGTAIVGAKPVSLRTTGTVRGLQAGDRVTVLHSRQTNAPGKFGVKPRAILKHQGKKTQAAPPARATEAGVEELILSVNPATVRRDAFNTAYGGRDVYVRTKGDVTLLNLNAIIEADAVVDEFGAYRSNTGAYGIQYGIADNMFAVSAGRWMNTGDDFTYSTRWYVFELSRNRGEASNTLSATHVRTVDMPTHAELPWTGAPGEDWNSYTLQGVGAPGGPLLTSPLTQFLTLHPSALPSWVLTLDGEIVFLASVTAFTRAIGPYFVLGNYEEYDGLVAVDCKTKAIVWRSGVFTRSPFFSQPETEPILGARDYTVDKLYFHDAAIADWSRTDTSRKKVVTIWSHDTGVIHVSAVGSVTPQPDEDGTVAIEGHAAPLWSERFNLSSNDPLEGQILHANPASGYVTAYLWGPRFLVGPTLFRQEQIWLIGVPLTATASGDRTILGVSAASDANAMALSARAASLVAFNRERARLMVTPEPSDAAAAYSGAGTWPTDAELGLFVDLTTVVLAVGSALPIDPELGDIGVLDDGVPNNPDPFVAGGPGIISDPKHAYALLEGGA